MIEVTERGKNHSWNLFVHSYSAVHAACLILMDADIAIQGSDSLWNMYRALEQDSSASVAVSEWTGLRLANQAVRSALNRLKL